MVVQPQVKVLHAKRPRHLMRRGKDIYARGSSGKAGGVIRHCRKVKANRGSVFQPTLRMAGLPIMLCSLVQCAADEKAAEPTRLDHPRTAPNVGAVASLDGAKATFGAAQE